MIHRPKLFPKHVLQSYLVKYQGSESLSPFKKQLLWVRKGIVVFYVVQCSDTGRPEFRSLEPAVLGEAPEHQDIRSHHHCTVISVVSVCRNKGQVQKTRNKVGTREVVSVTNKHMHFLSGKNDGLWSNFPKQLKTLYMKRH